jgi:ascorbate PTS system EIIB component
MAVCGTGLGSSFMLEMNIQEILKDLNVKGVEVEHTDLGSATSDSADVFVVARDIAEGAAHLEELIVLSSILDKDELQTKLKAALQQKGLI